MLYSLGSKNIIIIILYLEAIKTNFYIRLRKRGVYTNIVERCSLTSINKEIIMLGSIYIRQHR
jgi:hypothetical protein